MSKLKLTLGLVLIGLVIVFTLQNTAVVEVHFLLWTLSMSQVLLIFGLLVIGMALGWLISSLSRRHLAPPRRAG
ncbi:MAG: LapA family protein [Pseudomonadota bacterium]